MNWEQILGLEVAGIDSVRYLSGVSLAQLKEAVAAAELEVSELKASVAGMKAKAAAMKKNPFGGYFDDSDDLTKAQLFAKLKKLKAQKVSLSAEKAKLGLDISGFKIAARKTIKVKPQKGRTSAQQAIANLMDKVPETDQARYRNLESETLLQVATLVEEGFDPNEAYEIVVNGNGATAEILNFEEEEEDLF